MRSAGHVANQALPIVHEVSGALATLASACAVLTSETVIGGVTCGAVALGAAAVTAGTGAVLNAEGRGSNSSLALDTVAAGLAGFGSLAEAAAKAVQELSDTAAGVSLLRELETEAAPWYGNSVRGPQVNTGLSSRRFSVQLLPY